MNIIKYGDMWYMATCKVRGSALAVGYGITHEQALLDCLKDRTVVQSLLQ